MGRSIVGWIFAAWVVWCVPLAGVAQQPDQEQPTRPATDEEARALFDAGEVAYRDGRFRNAYERFRQAYELSHRSALLFNMGLAADRARMDREALVHYRQFLEDNPDAPNRSTVVNRIAELEQLLGGGAPALAARGAGVSPVGPIVMGGGGAVLAVGLVLGGFSLAVASDFSAQCADLTACLSNSRATYDEMRLLSAAADALIVAGVSVAALGLILTFVLPGVAAQAG